MPVILATSPFKKIAAPAFMLQLPSPLNDAEKPPLSSSFYKGLIDPRSDLVKQSLDIFQPRHKALTPFWRGFTLVLPHLSNRSAAIKEELPRKWANTFGAAGEVLGITLGAALSYGRFSNRFLSISGSVAGGLVSGRLLGWGGRQFGGLFD